MEGHSALCCSAEEIESVVGKLTEVMMISPMDLQLQQDLKGLMDDLEKICVSRNNKISDLITDEQVKVWVKQVKELIYDFEDWQLESKEGTSSSIWEPQRSWQILKFTALVKGARERYARYELHNKALPTDPDLVDDGHREASISAPSSKTEGTTDSSLLWGERAVLVGIDCPKIEIIQSLLKDKNRTTLTVVSIFGVGGIGKTTLANEVYKDLMGQFHCRASVSLGHNPSMKAILLDLLRQLHPWMYFDGGETSWDVQEVLVRLYEFLSYKRYLILVDDIQSTWAWKVINCAFPENDHGSRVLVTTRLKDVAELSSLCPMLGHVEHSSATSLKRDVYKMKPLSNDDSTKLLGNILGTLQKKRPADFLEVCERVLNMCSGIPLAIIVTGGLLKWNWSLHGKCNFPLLDQTYSPSELMRKLLDISFADLSLHLKYCFLFLSSFPVNYTINKDHLIRRWVAEGLIKERTGEGLWETGESYFNELIHRRLMEPVFDYNDDQAVGCTVHDVIYGFIASLARQDNFVAAAEDLVRGPFPCDTIRRYSVHCIGENDEADTLVSSAMHLSRIRYVTVSGDVRGTYDCLSAFKLVRVLDLKGTNFVDKSLTFLECLNLLQYLALGQPLPAGYCDIDLRTGFYKHLETLDVSRIKKAHFSAFIYTLPKLVAIIGDTTMDLEWLDRPKAMLNWEEVPTITVETNTQYYIVTELLLKSERLRKLGVNATAESYFTKYGTEKIVPFFTGLRECKAQCLLLDSDCMPNGWTPSPSLRRFVLKKFISSVPDTWPSSLVNLTHLDIQISEVAAQDIYDIGMLPKLNFLKLYSLAYDPKERLLIFGGFQSLKVAFFQCPDGGMGLQFQNKNTMPELRRLRIDFNERKTRHLYGRSFDFGLRFPLSLIEVHVTINCQGSTRGDVLDAEGAIKEQLRDHINKPSFLLRRDPENLSAIPAAVVSTSEASVSK